MTVRTARNQIGVNSLLIFNMPTEFGFKIGELPARIFGDFAVNLDAEDRARAAGHPDRDEERYAYQIGVGVGQLKVETRLADPSLLAACRAVLTRSEPG